MALGEFDLIRAHFDRRGRAGAPSPRQPLGIGDDCALLAPAPGMQLAVSTDMLVEGRHFFADVSPEALGRKALAVNLSDLAACGARPVAFTLALALPRVDSEWLAALASGLFWLADLHGIELVGGDTTAGPLNLCITVFGEVPVGAALLRSGARPGDDLWVSGTPGLARLGLDALRGERTLTEVHFAAARGALERPTPRVALGLALRGVASSAIDLSDGLLGDLQHVLTRSGATLGAYALGAEIELATLPRHAALQAQDDATQRRCLLAGGDDYELLFTAPATRREQVLSAAQSADTPVTRIGRIEANPGVRLREATGLTSAPEPGWHGFDHFRTHPHDTN